MRVRAAESAAGKCRSPEELRRSFPGDFFRCPECSVLLIDLDGLRADRLGYAGYRPSVSPFIDSLARKGIVFQNAAAQSDWTFPSAASVVTSRYPSVHKILASHDVFNTAMPTVFSAFAARGYRIFGNNERPFIASKSMSMDTQKFSFGNAAYVSEVAAEFDFISTSAAPALAYVANMDMHAPYWREGTPDEPPEVIEAQELRLGFHGEAVSTSAVRGLNRAYDQRVRYVDARLRDLFARISGAGLRERAIIFLFSNHGEELLEHSTWGHGYGYSDEEIHVPLILLHPKVSESNAARVCPQVELIDIAPTALAMTGATAARFGAGRSLLPLLQGLVGGDVFKYAFSEGANKSPTQGKMARSLEWKLISTLDGSYLLYDLVRDPAETRDVKNENPKASEEMKSVLEAWEKSGGAPYPPGSYRQSEAEKALLIKNGYW